MALLVAGVLVFIGAHLLPSFSTVRSGLRERLGAGPYMGLFSLVALTGLILVIVGMGQALFEGRTSVAGSLVGNGRGRGLRRHPARAWLAIRHARGVRRLRALG
ncbi:MAG: hypothetical protein HKN10_04715, partial [Myxococcales bacterium]|nr:hypothetical protein [Myxococcales bacterium]